MATNPYTLTDQAGALLAALHRLDSSRVWRPLPGTVARTDPACTWGRARRRYMRRIAALPVVPSPIGGRPACQSCRHWRSRNGETGYCAMPETPSTVNCGATKATDLCEQWDAWPEEETERAERLAARERVLKKVAYIRRTAHLRQAAFALESEGWRVTGPEGGFVGWMSEGTTDELPLWLTHRKARKR